MKNLISLLVISATLNSFAMPVNTLICKTQLKPDGSPDQQVLVSIDNPNSFLNGTVTLIGNDLIELVSYAKEDLNADCKTELKGSTSQEVCTFKAQVFLDKIFFTTGGPEQFGFQGFPESKWIDGVEYKGLKLLSTFDGRLRYNRSNEVVNWYFNSCNY